MGVVFKNNATSTLAAAISDSETSLTIDLADADKFPMPGVGEWFPLSLVDNFGNIEIVKVTARASNVLTVARGQEGTAALSFVAARVDFRLTAGALAAAFNQDNMSDGTTNKNYTATEQTKLSGIETGADVTEATNVAAAGAFMYRGELGADVDLDTLTDPGWWTQIQSAQASTDLNYPSANAGVLTVRASSGSGMVWQEYQEYRQIGNVYTREFYSVWGPWRRAVLASDTSATSIGFVVDEDDMASDSATKVPTQQSVKAYHDLRRNAHSVLEYGTVDLTGATSSQTAVVAAVAAAYSGGFELYWPAGTYLTTASIPNLHDVRHSGPGVIKRGADLFQLNPTPTKKNVIYVAAAGGGVTNDGLTSSQPISTLQAAQDVLLNYPMPLQGTWEFQLAAGTWTEGSVMSTSISSRNPIRFFGPSVTRAVPTAIIDGTNASKNTGFSFPAASNIYMKDIRVQKFAQNNFAYAILHVDGSQLYCDNVDVINSWFGVGSRGHTKLRYRYGRIVGNNQGVLAIDFALITIGYSSSATVSSITTNRTFAEDEGTLIRDNVTGVYATENVQGHIDYCMIYNNSAQGIYMAYGTRLNIPYCNINTNASGINTQAGSWPINLETCTFAGNTKNRVNGAYSGRTDSNFGKLAVGQVAFLGSSTTSTAAPATTGSYQKHIDSFALLPGGGLTVGTGRLRVRIAGSVNKGSTASGRAIGVRLYAGAGFIAIGLLRSDAAAAGNFVIDFEVFATGASAQKYVGDVRAGGTSTSFLSQSSIGTTALDLSVNQTMHIYTSRDSSSDTFTIETVSAEMYGDMG